jgi:protein-disulfide isomerase
MENTEKSIFKDAQFLLGLFAGIAVISFVGMLILGIAFLKADGKMGSGNYVPTAGNPTAPAAPGAVVDVVVSDDDHIRGPKNAKITILEWSDFQCSFCERFSGDVLKILADYPNDVRQVYRHFPIDSIHPQARLAAEASECAADQGKFWEYHDELFANQTAIVGGASYLKGVAGKLGLKQGDFDKCLDSKKYAGKVDAQYQEGIAAGVQGTPGSFLNGQALGGALPYDALKAQIESML